MSTPFTADPAFDAGSVFAVDWPLCQVRLQDDARFPWLILIPRRTGIVELGHLTPADRATLWDEALRAGDLVRALGERLGRPVDKLNTAAIGNVTAQLHLHVVGRRKDDALWPDPVWGRGPADRYDDAARAEVLRLIAEGAN